MTTRDLEKLIKQELSSEGLIQYLDDRQEQYLEFPDGFFAEVVLNDGSKLSEVERIVKAIKERLQKQEIDVDVIVRAIWKVTSVRYVGHAVGASGGVKAAEWFAGTLRSGNRECKVIVDVTNYAYDSIWKKLSEERAAHLPTDKNEAIADIVADFLQFELSRGGASYWDPILHPERELNDAALLYVM
ncbi:MAG: hypothetical protein ACRD19_02610, partial [Terriglobia bacterium]